MAAAQAGLLLPAVRVAPGPASSGAPARPPHARVRPLFAAGTPPPPVSVALQRCAHKAGGNFGGDPDPGDDVHGPALDALRCTAVDAFRPLMDNFGRVFSVKYAVDVNDYNIGIPFGVVMACLGCYQLFKADPSAFQDAVLGYAFYKLSVISSDVDRRGFVNDVITMIKAAIVVIFLIRELHNRNPYSLVWVFIKVQVFYLYLTTFYFTIKGLKQEARCVLYNIVEALRRGLTQILFGPHK